MEKKIDISKKYSHELDEINEKLNNLANGRIYELTNYRQDGYLGTNIEKLRKLLNELISKIEYDKKTAAEEAAELFKKK